MKGISLILLTMTLLLSTGCQSMTQWINPKNLEKTPLKEQTPSVRPSAGPPEGKEQTNLRLIMVGDILLASTIEKLMDAQGEDYPWVKVKNHLQEADLAIGNLETSVATVGKAVYKQYTFQARPSALKEAKAAGIDVLTTANNHTLDFGTESLLETLRNLNKYEIKTAGAGRNEKEAFKPATLKVKGKKIAVLAASRVIPTPDWRAQDNQPGLATTYDPTLLLEAIKTAKKTNDLVIVSVHWGKELASYPEKYQVHLAHQYIDAGADIVLGHHPHVLQGFELYQGKVIAYSMGNFIFTSRSEITRDSAMLVVEQDQEGQLHPSVIPVFITAGQPAPVDLDDPNHDILSKLRQLSQPFNTTLDKSGNVIPD